MKLAKLPDRTPVKMTFTLAPSLAARLRDYAEYYAETYGSREDVVGLVPFMLEAFLDGDADFRRASRAGGAKESSSGESRKPAIGGTRKSQRQGPGNLNGS
jgi:hypothetical protein